MLDKFGTGGTESYSEVACRMRIVGVIKFFVNIRSLELECANVLDEVLFVPVIMHGCETIV